MGELCQGQAAPVTAAPRRLAERRIRFSNDVELYVGSETDIVMAKWQHVLEVSHTMASPFHTEWEHDQTSFLAHRVPGPFPVHVEQFPTLLKRMTQLHNKTIFRIRMWRWTNLHRPKHMINLMTPGRQELRCEVVGGLF